MFCRGVKLGLTLLEEHRLTMFENKKGGLYNQFYNLFSLQKLLGTDGQGL